MNKYWFYKKKQRMKEEKKRPTSRAAALPANCRATGANVPRSDSMTRSKLVKLALIGAEKKKQYLVAEKTETQTLNALLTTSLKLKFMFNPRWLQVKVMTKLFTRRQDE